jgi:hypothetical protein
MNKITVIKSGPVGEFFLGAAQPPRRFEILSRQLDNKTTIPIRTMYNLKSLEKSA